MHRLAANSSPGCSSSERAASSWQGMYGGCKIFLFRVRELGLVALGVVDLGVRGFGDLGFTVGRYSSLGSRFRRLTRA